MRILVLSFGLAGLLSTEAHAQADRASRSDVRDIRRRVESTAPVPPRSSRDEFVIVTTSRMAEPEGWSGTLSIAGAYASNAGQIREPRIDTVYATPAFSLAYDKSAIGDGWSLHGGIDSDADLYARSHGDLDESRISAELALSKAFRPGTLTLAVRSRAAFGSAFDGYFYTRGGPVIGFEPRFAEAAGLLIEAEYRFSDDPAQRRFIVSASGEHGLYSQRRSNGATLDLTFAQEFRFSSFRAGDNDGRRDLLSASTLKFDPALFSANGVSLKLTGTLFHNFSNRRLNRFTDLEIGPVITFEF